MVEVSNAVALVIIALVVLGLFFWGGCKIGCGANKDNFTRTCLTADTNCQFVRSPVDYIYKTMTSIPEKVGKDYPHLMADRTDELQPLDQSPGIELVRDENKLWNPDKLWKQYENNWSGCGNGKPYIVNDEKTRFELTEVGNEWAHRILNGQSGPRYGPPNPDRALTDLDYIMPEPFDRMYGGSDYLPHNIGYS